MGKKPREIDLESLSEGARAAVAAKRLAGQDTFRHWRKLLGELAAFDTQTDELRRKAASRRTLYIVLAVICFVLLIFIPGMASGVSSILAAAAAAVLLAPGVIFIVLAVVHARKASRLKAVDLANEFRDCIIPFWDDLGEDMDDRGRLKLDLDLSGITAQKVVAERAVPPGRFRKVTETVYNDPWCRMAFRLADGNVATLDLRNYVVRQKREWRNPRGKYKSKEKWTKTVIASASLVPDVNDTEWDEARLAERAKQEKLKVKDKKGARTARLVRKWKFKTVNTEPDNSLAPDQLMGMLMQLYSLLQRPAAGRTGN